ncbi:MAG: hypothetical protein BWX48_00002 [Verrucomicrobia bacterium ADurb.Bin006]|nr:MAG: hypothetical protein BWX48_00002 [Verrucomicrobia bacterium ADurb.Bin006]
MVSICLPTALAHWLLETPSACTVPWLRTIPPCSGSSRVPARATAFPGPMPGPGPGIPRPIRTGWLLSFHRTSSSTELGRLISGVILATPDSFFQRSISREVMILVRLAPPPGPPGPKGGHPPPGITVMRSKPMDLNCRLICRRTPEARETRSTMVMVPTTTPREAKPARTFLRPRFCQASPSWSCIFISQGPPNRQTSQACSGFLPGKYVHPAGESHGRPDLRLGDHA